MISQLILINTAVFVLWIAIVDYKKYLIPNRLLQYCFLFNFTLIIFETRLEFKTYFEIVSYSLISFIFYLLLYFFSQKTFGLGDVKYSFVLSIPVAYLFDYRVVLDLHLLAFVIGGIWALWLLIFKKINKNHTIAFGPFMSLSYFLIIALNL